MWAYILFENMFPRYLFISNFYNHITDVCVLKNCPTFYHKHWKILSWKPGRQLLFPKVSNTYIWLITIHLTYYNKFVHMYKTRQQMGTAVKVKENKLNKANLHSQFATNMIHGLSRSYFSTIYCHPMRFSLTYNLLFMYNLLSPIYNLFNITDYE